ncbi:hypothetical protein [Nannocystis punicea]|uniref:Uncharacterized protein n=1 Tax=Nannocystis punicea TaxID=2995304 RepID=A0ABY7H9W4_9BACT|nr:hypothetical protein [Nannocystis poenicansa]WAS96038.1 hypothetical protein O0S08_07725 [Nannocystis poenicansa]
MHLCRKACSNKLIPAAQAARNCALPWFDQRKWTSAKVRPRWMGLPPRLDIDERGAEAKPAEDVENEGCPGSWYRTPFIDSVLRYRRRPTEGGGRVSSPFLERCLDELVLEAIQLMEAYEDSWHAEHLHQIRLTFDRKGGYA